MRHVPFNDGLLTIRGRIGDRGYNSYGPVDHEMCHSTYLVGLPDPRGMSQEARTMVLGVRDEVIAAPTDDSKPPVSVEDSLR